MVKYIFFLPTCFYFCLHALLQRASEALKSEGNISKEPSREADGNSPIETLDLIAFTLRDNISQRGKNTVKY